MTINFPGSLDNFTNPTSASPINSPSHADQHANANDAIEALEAKVGVDGSSVVTSHDYKIAQLQSLVTSAVAGAKSIYQDVRNQSGSAFTKATPVYVSGSTGASGQLLVSAASNATEATSSKTMGITTSAISNNSNGQVISEGILEGIDTTGAADGDPVWLGVDGAKIYGLANKPSAPAHLVFLGVIIRGGQANTGSMYVKIQNGFELQEIHNVEISSLVNGNILAYDSTTQTWKNTNTLQSTSSTIPLVVKASASQSVDIFQIQNGSGNAMFWVNQYGQWVGNQPFYSYNRVFIQPNNTSTQGLIVKGLASQTANLQEWQDSAGTVKAFVRSDGFIRADASLQTPTIYGTSATNGTQANIATAWTFVTNVATNVGIIIKGAASQTANLQEWQNSSGTVLSKITASGAFGTNVIVNALGTAPRITLNDASSTVLITAATASTIGLLVKAAASQTANLQEWQDSSGTVLAKISSNGQITSNIQSSSAISTPLVLQNSATGVGTGTALTMNYGNNDYATIESAYLTAPGAGGAYLALKTKHSTTSTITTKLLIDNQGTVTINGFVAGAQGLIIKGAASQTANLQEWQNDAGTAIARIKANGNTVLIGALTVNQSNTFEVGDNYGIGSFEVKGTSFMIPRAATGVGLIIRGFTSQTADLQQWQDNAGNVKALIGSGGNGVFNGIRSGSGSTTGAINAYTTAAQIGILVRGAASQTANLQEWQNSAGTYLARIESTGKIVGTSDLVISGGVAYFNAAGDTNGTFISVTTGRGNFVLQNPSAIGLTVKGAASQTANLQEWQDSAGTVLTKIDNNAGFYAQYIEAKNTAGILVNGESQIKIASPDGLKDIRFWNRNDAGGLYYYNSSGGSKNILRVAHSSDPRVTTQAWQDFTSGNSANYGGRVNIDTSITTAIGMVIRGTASQTANLQEWQNSSGTVLSKIDASGNITAPSYNLSDSKYLLRKTIKKTVDPAGNAIANNTYDLFDMNFPSSLQGTLYIQASIRGPGYGQNLTYSLPVTYAMDWINQYPITNPFTNSTTWVDLTPLTFSPRHLMTNDYFKFQAKVNNNQISFRIKLTGTLTGSPLFDIYIQHSEEFANTTITELNTTGTDATTSNVMPNSLSSKAGLSAIFNPITLYSNSASNTPLTVKAFASQTANLQEWQNSSGTVNARIDAYGTFQNGTASNYGAWINVQPALASDKGIIIRGAASQTANLQQWQSSAGTVVAYVDSSGLGYFTHLGTTTNTGYIQYPYLRGYGDSVSSISLTGSQNVAFGTGLGSFGGGTKVLYISNATAVPTSNPTGGGILYSESGALKWRGSGGAVTTVARSGSESVTVSANTATTIDTNALATFTTAEYVVSIKQGSKIRSSKVLVQTDGTSVDSTEYGIMEMGGGISGILVTASVSGTDAILEVTITDAATTNATVKLIKTML